MNRDKQERNRKEGKVKNKLRKTQIQRPWKSHLVLNPPGRKLGEGKKAKKKRWEWAIRGEIQKYGKKKQAPAD